MFPNKWVTEFLQSTTGELGFVRIAYQLSITASRPVKALQPGWMQVTGAWRAHKAFMASKSRVEKAR